MKQQWFQAEDGTYYRNCPLIRDEMGRALRSGRLLLWRKLEAEWYDVFREGVTSKTALERGDVLAQPGSFREAYPRNPGLWALDDR
jgi:hypothetical protein